MDCWRISALVACLLIASVSPSLANLVTDPGFESCPTNPPPPGWSGTGGCDTIAHTGSWSAGFEGTSTLSQSIPTTAGTMYDFSFWVSSINLITPNQFTVTFGAAGRSDSPGRSTANPARAWSSPSRRRRRRRTRRENTGTPSSVSASSLPATPGRRAAGRDRRRTGRLPQAHRDQVAPPDRRVCGLSRPRCRPRRALKHTPVIQSRRQRRPVLPDHPYAVQQHQSLARRHPSRRQRQAPPALPSGVVLPVQSPQSARRFGRLSDPARRRMRHHHLRPTHRRHHAEQHQAHHQLPATVAQPALADADQVLDLVNTIPTTYTFEDFTVTATAASTTITFVGTSQPGDGAWLLDDVSVTAVSAVPEPPTLGLFAVAALGLAALYRRRA